MLPVLGLEYLHFPHNDGLIHTHLLPNSQAAIVQVVDWDLVCDRTALLSTGNSCFVKNKWQTTSFILFCCKNLLFKTDAICCSAGQLHGRSLCWLSLLGLGQVMQDCLESSNLENILNLFFRLQRQIWSASQHFDCSCHSGERLSLQILRG